MDGLVRLGVYMTCSGPIASSISTTIARATTSEGRADLRRLREDSKPGDIVICRDQSRVGRDALEVTLAVREMVQDRGARLFYYIESREVPYESVIDAAMTFVQRRRTSDGVEAIRSRVREALRSRVRAGRIAGGRCFGYALRREHRRVGSTVTRSL